jgi:ATP-dependent DNA helicase PIF1
MVEMYVKIESERFRYLRFNQKNSACRRFSKQLLNIGDGKATTYETGYIKLPTNFCTILYSKDALIDQLFLNVHRQYTNHEWLTESAILVSKNVDVNELNLKIQYLVPGDLVSCKSIDTVCDGTEAVNYRTEFLNSLDLSGMPPHNLKFKV